MDQYETYDGRLKWIGLRNVQNGVFAMVVTDDANAYYDEQSARAYLNSKEINYKLDIIPGKMLRVLLNIKILNLSSQF